MTIFHKTNMLVVEYHCEVQRACVQQQTVEHGHVHGFVNGQVYNSIQTPKTLRVTEHVQIVCTKGPGDEAAS